MIKFLFTLFFSFNLEANESLIMELELVQKVKSSVGTNINRVTRRTTTNDERFLSDLLELGFSTSGTNTLNKANGHIVMDRPTSRRNVSQQIINIEYSGSSSSGDHFISSLKIGAKNLFNNRSLQCFAYTDPWQQDFAILRLSYGEGLTRNIFSLMVSLKDSSQISLLHFTNSDDLYQTRGRIIFHPINLSDANFFINLEKDPNSKETKVLNLSIQSDFIEANNNLLVALDLDFTCALQTKSQVQLVLRSQEEVRARSSNANTTLQNIRTTSFSAFY